MKLTFRQTGVKKYNEIHFQTDFPEKQSEGEDTTKYKEEKKRRKDPSVYKCWIIGHNPKEEGQQVVLLDMYFVSGLQNEKPLQNLVTDIGDMELKCTNTKYKMQYYKN